HHAPIHGIEGAAGVTAPLTAALETASADSNEPGPLFALSGGSSMHLAPWAQGPRQRRRRPGRGHVGPRRKRKNKRNRAMIYETNQNLTHPPDEEVVEDYASAAAAAPVSGGLPFS